MENAVYLKKPLEIERFLGKFWTPWRILKWLFSWNILRVRVTLGVRVILSIRGILRTRVILGNKRYSKNKGNSKKKNNFKNNNDNKIQSSDLFRM